MLIGTFRSNGALASAPAALALLGGCIPQGHGPDPRYRPQAPPVAEHIPDQTRAAPQTPRAPTWTARSVEPDATSVGTSIYTVRNGDTLGAIANRTGAASHAIARMNGLSPPYAIYPGQQLRIPAGRYHLVRAGETGIAIARAYGVPWSQMVAANDLEEPYILRVGQRLLIPENRPMTPAERAAAFNLDIDDLVTGSEPAIAKNERPTQPTTSPSRTLATTKAVQPPARMKGGFSWPVRGKLIKSFGPGKSGERNDGVTIGVPIGTPVFAAADGVVVYVGNGIPALGGLVMLKHGDGYTTVYGHTSQILVQRGQKVDRGQKIALSGETGFADQPELHFEIRKGRTPVDPQSKLPAL